MNLKLRPLIVFIIFIFIMVLLGPPFLAAYGALSQEELIDWNSDIKPAASTRPLIKPTTIWCGAWPRISALI